jgi:hypothetical protein
MFYPVLDHKPKYQEFIVEQPAHDEAIGKAARVALNAVVIR